MKYFIVLIGAICSFVAPAQIKNIEHFFVSSPDAKKLFYFFKDNFNLPVLWHYEAWKTYASGGLTLGETPLEFLRFANDTSTKTLFAGIALQPTVGVNKLMRIYDSLHVSYGDEYIDTFTENNIKDTGFINLKIKNTLPGNVYFFTCDYKYRLEMDTMEMKAADSLKTIHGGGLGIIALKEIVVGCTDLTSYSNALSKLPGIKKEKNNLFRFSKGPSIRLVNSDSEGIQKIILTVHSLAAARGFLKQKNMSGESTKNAVMINPEAIEGLRIELTGNFQ